MLYLPCGAQALPRVPLTLVLGLQLMMLGACSTVAERTKVEPDLLDSALKVVGLQRAQDAPKDPSVADKPAKPVKLSFRVHSGSVLNTDEAGNSLTLIARIYKLKDTEAFLQAPYEAFKDPASEKAALGDALIEVKEVMLKPSGKFEAIQVLAPDVPHIGIVALFRAPAEHRWRFAFDAKESSKAGITLGAHGCALSVAEGATVGAAPESLRLAGVECD
jgi:type VI secretion system protein VasD